MQWLTNMRIPEEIQNFWIKSGKKLGGCASTICFVWHCSDDKYYSQGGPPPPLRQDVLARGTIGNMTYYLEGFFGKSYTEKEMLKLVKMKAFL
jgi:hypothetical protein